MAHVRDSVRLLHDLEPAAAAVVAVAAMVQPIAFRGVQPKNWLTPGVWITAESAAMEPRLLSIRLVLQRQL
jgi:hypothetical protein